MCLKAFKPYIWIDDVSSIFTDLYAKKNKKKQRVGLRLERVSEALQWVYNQGLQVSAHLV